MILDNWLAQRAQTCPDRTALIADDSRLTYEELEAEATAAARRLAAHGVRGGAVVTLELPVGTDYVVLLHALMKVGAVQEAVLRKSFLKNGEYLDQVLWAIVEDDWRAQQEVEHQRSSVRPTIH